MFAPLARPDSPQSFLPLVHGRREHGTIFIARKLSANPDDFRHHPYPVNRLAAAAAAALQYHAEAEVYLSVAAFTGARRKRDGVLSVPCLWLDRDGHRLSSKLPQPTVTIETSPGRFQDLWCLFEPVPPDVAEDLTRRIAHVCGCSNAAVAANQVVRIPGTINHGIGKDRAAALVRVVSYAPYAIYVPGNFRHLPPAPPVIEPVVRKAGIVDGEKSLRRALRSLDPRMHLCAAGEPVTKPDGTPYPSESERDQALITALVRAGLTDDEVAAAFIATQRGPMRAGRKIPKYIWARVVIEAAKARRWLAEHNFEAWEGIPYLRLDLAVLARAPQIGPEGVAVMTALALHANKGNEAWPSQETVAAFLGCSPDLVGIHLRRLRDVHGLLRLTGQIGRVRVYTLVTTDHRAVRVPRHLITALAGSGPLAVAIMVLVAAQARLAEAPDLTQAELAARLGIRRERVNVAMRKLVAAGHLRVMRGGARGLQYYGLAAPVVRLSGTNNSHRGGLGEEREESVVGAPPRALPVPAASAVA